MADRPIRQHAGPIWRNRWRVPSYRLEHAVPERMFTNEQNPGEAISAVKALQKANAQGQRIYHITPANRGGTLSQIHHTPFVMEEIRNALNAGKEVITHTDAVSVPGWTGAGYILFDPNTGDGAFKIGGGMNGGFVAGLLSGIAFYLGIAAAFIPMVATAFWIAMFALTLFAFSIWLLWYYDGTSGCFYAGLLTTVAIMLVGVNWVEVTVFDRIWASLAAIFGAPAVWDVLAGNVPNCFR